MLCSAGSSTSWWRGRVPPGDPDKPRTDTDMPGDFGLPFPLEIRKLAVGRLEIQPPAVNG